MHNFKKILSIALAISLFSGTFISCNATPATNQVEERVKITYWDAFSVNMQSDSYTEQLIETALPVDIVVSRTDHTNISSVMRLLDERYMPDVIWYSADSEYIMDLGISRTIPYEMIAEYAPSFLDLYEENPTILTTITHPDNLDEFFALTGTTEQSSRVANSLYADFYRYDWIQSLDIDLGVEVTQLSDNIFVADTGLTLEKFEEVMHAFTYGDPDGNGIDDTYGASFDELNRFDLLYSAFGIINGVNEFNGEAEMFYATDNFKEFMVWFNDMFNKGYIDNNFFYQTRESRWENVQNEVCGYFLESSIALNTWASDRPPLSMIESNPEATFLLTPGLNDENGNGSMIKNAMPTYGRLCYINKDVDDEKLALILQTLEYINFGEEKLSMWFGEEGVDWQFDKNGNFEELNVLQVAEKGSRVFVQNVQTGDLFDAITMQPLFESGADFWLDDCLWRENDREEYQYKLDLRKETNYAQLYIDYGSLSYNIMLNYFENWIYNDLDVNASWEGYLQELDNVGYNLMMGELDKVEPLETMILDFIR